MQQGKSPEREHRAVPLHSGEQNPEDKPYTTDSRTAEAQGLVRLDQVVRVLPQWRDRTTSNRNTFLSCDRSDPRGWSELVLHLDRSAHVDDRRLDDNYDNDDCCSEIVTEQYPRCITGRVATRHRSGRQHHVGKVRRKQLCRGCAKPSSGPQPGSCIGDDHDTGITGHDLHAPLPVLAPGRKRVRYDATSVKGSGFRKDREIPAGRDEVHDDGRLIRAFARPHSGHCGACG
jgi:hypothetical protein